MTNNKKFWLILILFLLIPNVLIWLSPEIENYKRDFYISDYKNLLLIITFISLLSPLYILYINYKSGYNSRLWYVLVSTILFFGVVYLYIIYSLSNFGF